MNHEIETQNNEVAQVDRAHGDLIGTTADRGVHVAGQVSKYGQDEREALRALGGLDEASDGDIDMLKIVSDRAGLDPFARQIYLVGRKTKVGGYRGEQERWETKWTVQVGIDGFRSVTHRYAEKASKAVTIGRPIFYDADGNQRMMWLKKWGNPEAVEVTVKVGESEATAVATWDEYVQTKRNGDPNSMWEKMGPTMLSKCAEAQAHRRICPLTAGMYAPEEMAHLDTPRVVQSQRLDKPTGGVAALKARAKEPEQQQEIEQAPVDNQPDLAAELLTQIGQQTTEEGLGKVMADAADLLESGDIDQATYNTIRDTGRNKWQELQA